MTDATVLIEVLVPGERADHLLEQLRTKYAVTPAQVGLPMEQSRSSRDLFKAVIPEYKVDGSSASPRSFLNGVDAGWQEVLHLSFKL